MKIIREEGKLTKHIIDTFKFLDENIYFIYYSNLFFVANDVNIKLHGRYCLCERF